MKKIIFGLLALTTMTSSGQAVNPDFKAVNDAMIAYFIQIANICGSTPPYQNAASGVLRDRIAGNVLPDDHDYQDPLPPDPNNPLAHPNINLSDPNATQLLNVFKKFATLNQHAFASHLNHRVDVLALESVLGDVENDWQYLTLLGADIADLFVSAGTDVDGWTGAVATIQAIAAQNSKRKKLGGGDNGTNGFVSESVEDAQSQANLLLVNCNFDPGMFEGKIKIILSKCFSDLHQLRQQYYNRHKNWLNPGWQFTYESIMRATALALQNLTNCNQLKVLSVDKPITLMPQTYTKTIYTNHLIARLRKGVISDEFVYSKDTMKIEVPINYRVSFEPADAVLCNYNRTAQISLSSIHLETINVATTTEVHNDIRKVVSNRTYRKLHKVWRRRLIDAAVNDAATNGK